MLGNRARKIQKRDKGNREEEHFYSFPTGKTVKLQIWDTVGPERYNQNCRRPPTYVHIYINITSTQ